MTWDRRLGVLFRRGGLAGIAALFLVAAPWYIWVGVETKANFLYGFLMNHHVDRFLSPMENHGGFPGFYVVMLFLGLMPWSIFLGLAVWCGLWSAVRQPWTRWTSTWQQAADQNDATDSSLAVSRYRFLWTWIAVYLLFFSLAATKLPNYVLPAVVPTALVLARFLDRWRLGQVRVPARWMYAGLAGLIGLGVALSLGLALAGGSISWPGLKLRTFAGLQEWSVIGLVPVIAGALAWHMLRRQRPNSMIACLALGAWLLIGLMASWAAALFNDYKAPALLVAQSGALQPHEDIRIGCWQMGHLASLNFYVQRDITHLQNEEDVIGFLDSHLTVYLFLSAGDWESLRSRMRVPCHEVARSRDLYRSGEAVVVTNH
jgi:4-amino-4-deoxy-L-arabinose transferase-like glycosyltransferase